MNKPIDLTGQRFGRLLVLGRAGNKAGHALWECRCTCGGLATVAGYQLRRGGTKSCGCLHREVTARGSNLKHGRTIGGPSREYRAWYGMIQRTPKPKKKKFPNYGGGGGH